MLSVGDLARSTRRAYVIGSKYQSLEHVIEGARDGVLPDPKTVLLVLSREVLKYPGEPPRAFVLVLDLFQHQKWWTSEHNLQHYEDTQDDSPYLY